MSTSPLELDSIVIGKIRGHRILDVGCGYGKWGFLVKKYFWATLDGDSKLEPYVAGVDLFEPSLKRLAQHRIYDELQLGNGKTLPFKDKTFDTVLGMELIEHLKKEEGRSLLTELERVAKRCVIISTPNYPDFRGGIDGLDGFNQFENHLSLWKPGELSKLGYRCYGVGMKFGPRKLRVLGSGFSYALPWLGTHLIGRKLFNEA